MPGKTVECPPSRTKEWLGIWRNVSDELGNEGWVPSGLFNLAK
jgi:hypothetical protein